jgi:hypothetical protein
MDLLVCLKPLKHNKVARCEFDKSKIQKSLKQVLDV